MTEINIKSDIVSNDYKMMYNFFGLDSFTPKDLTQALTSASENEDVVVNIASNGGDVFAAFEMYSMLKDFNANVVVNIQGLAASAASVIAMAGDTVNISPVAQIMIHKAMSAPQGNSDDMEHEAQVLNGIDQSIAAAYELKTGMNQTDLLQLMSNETWMTAQDAVDKGFADSIMFVDQNKPVFSNSISNIPSADKLNDFMNFINYKTNKGNPIIENKKDDEDNKKQADLRSRKLAILLKK